MLVIVSKTAFSKVKHEVNSSLAAVTAVMGLRFQEQLVIGFAPMSTYLNAKIFIFFFKKARI